MRNFILVVVIGLVSKYILNPWAERTGHKLGAAFADMSTHKKISFIKSTIRLIGYVLIPFSLWWAAGVLFVSELIGILEEVGEK